ncbi:MAG: YbdD/YjiX family protein [Methylotenera sp.]|nr:YbdD/YjiX family protein [Methylotenera sp.]
MIKALKTKCVNLWSLVRRLSGDDAYEQYSKHYAEAHSNIENNLEEMPPLLSREEFFRQWQDGKWKGVKRCC